MTSLVGVRNRQYELLLNVLHNFFSCPTVHNVNEANIPFQDRIANALSSFQYSTFIEI